MFEIQIILESFLVQLYLKILRIQGIFYFYIVVFFQWITNILEHKAEQENVIYEDPDKDNGFVLVTDFKWDGQTDTLKLLALPFQKIRSLRQLNGSHLSLLKNIRDAGTAAISKKFNIPTSQLRIYFHYQPSYYYLHVHFCYLMFDAPGKLIQNYKNN